MKRVDEKDKAQHQKSKNLSNVLYQVVGQQIGDYKAKWTAYMETEHVFAIADQFSLDFAT